MTAHIEAKYDEIAKVVIMPGDPIRAQVMAEKYLKDAKLVNKVRGVYAYTGTYKDTPITIMASGMGNPSMGIYSYELYKYYDVELIIRVGSVGSYTKDLGLYEVLLVDNVYSTSNFRYEQCGSTDKFINAFEDINNLIYNIDKTIKRGLIYCSDVFYSDIIKAEDMKNKGILGVEMESFALFNNAINLNKKAACLLTVSNNFETNEETTSEERQNSFTKMFELALEASKEYLEHKND